MTTNLLTGKLTAKTALLCLAGIALSVFVRVAYFAPLTRDTRVSHTVEATKLRLELRTNQAAAHLKYDGKLIELNGKAHSVTMTGKAPVLSIGVMFTNVDCHLEQSMTEIASRIRIGLPVAVKGKAHTLGSDVFLKPCILM